MLNEPLRQIRSGYVTLKTFDVTDVGAEPVAWLTNQVIPGMLLLAHADDGVIWGKVIASAEGAQIIFPPTTLLPQAPLRTETLIMVRCFDVQQELFLWRLNEGEWRARRIADGVGEPCDYYDERQILWGTQATEAANGFVKMIEGAQGMLHAPPVELLASDGQNQEHRVRLPVRHYLLNDEGWLRVGYSRLVKAEAKEAVV